MKDYLEIFEKFKEIKEIKDLIDEVNKLRQYYRSRQYEKMQEHISSLTLKYLKETLAWNAVNRDMPTNHEQSFINAENFLAAQGAKKITELIFNYKKTLSSEETSFIETMSRLTE